MKRLTLKRERLAELTIDDLSNVVGGAVTKDCEKPTIDRCLTGYYPSLNAPCTTLTTGITTGTN